MKILLLMLSLALAGAARAVEPAPNTLADQEVRDGWQLLFDGKTTTHWRSLAAPEFPAAGWTIRDGVLTVEPGSQGGDLVTVACYTNFDFQFEFRLTPGANSGVKYFVDAEHAKGKAGFGCEYQLLDDARHPDAKARADGSRKLAALYDILPAPDTKPVRPVGEWNQGRIVVRDRHVEHWLNGAKVLAYERGSDAFLAAVARSKFAKAKNFGERPDGHLLLQDHNDRVSFRNLKIKPL